MDPRLKLGLFILGVIIASHLWSVFTTRMMDRTYERYWRARRGADPPQDLPVSQPTKEETP
jgi:hypothetical protein